MYISIKEKYYHFGSANLLHSIFFLLIQLIVMSLTAFDTWSQRLKVMVIGNMLI